MQFQGELQLTRRAGVCGGESRAGEKKSWRNDEDRWLTNGSNIRKRDVLVDRWQPSGPAGQVWMVENIKRHPRGTAG